MIKFYAEANVPTKWYLCDLLYWVAFDVLPQADYFGLEPCEARQSFNIFYEAPLDIGNRFLPAFISPENTKRVGMGPDPEWLLSITNGIIDPHPITNYVDQVLTNRQENSPFITAQYTRDEIVQDNQFMPGKYVIDWMQDLESYLDRFKAELLLKLRDGELEAEGLVVPMAIDNEDEQLEALYDYFEANVVSKSAYDRAFQRVTVSDWIMRKINWHDCFIKHEDSLVCSIRGDLSDVMSVFPPKLIGQVNLNQTESGNMFIADNSTTPKRQTAQMGRPRKNWDAVYVQLTKLVLEHGGLPRKQDAVAQELVNWYFDKFGERLGLSTVKARLKEFYDSLEKS